MTLALHPHVVQDRLEEQTQETRWDGQLGMDAAKKGATYGVWKGCAESDADVRELMGLNEAKMAQAMAAEPSWDAAEPHRLPRFPPHHYLPPCLVVVEVH